MQDIFYLLYTQCVHHTILQEITLEVTLMRLKAVKSNCNCDQADKPDNKFHAAQFLCPFFTIQQEQHTVDRQDNI